MGAALPIADHHDALDLRALARREKNGRAASRMVALAKALDGMTRTAAARLAGTDRQTLRDWAVRCNADGIDGLYDQPKGHDPEKLSESEQAVLLAKIFKILIPCRTASAPGR
jgi:transposase